MTLAFRALSVLILALPLALLGACSSTEDKVAGHLEKARAYLADQDYTKAALEAKNVVQIQPNNAEAHFILAKAAWREGKFEAAFPELHMAVESDPTLVEARLRLGDLYYLTGNIKEAAAQAEATRRLAPGRADVHLLSGKVLFLQGDLEGSAAEVDAALAANPVFVDAITAKAGLLGQQRDTAGALAVLDSGLANTLGADRDVLSDFRLGFLLNLGEDVAYEKGLLALIKEFPQRTKYSYQLVQFYAARGRQEDEERTLRELLTTDPTNHVVPVRLASMLASRNDQAGAEQLLKDSIAKFPTSAELQISLGDYYRYRKRSPEAMAAYRQAASQWAETTPEGLKARGRIVAQHTLDGETEQARAVIEKILAVEPDNGDALLSRATFEFFNRQFDAAIADLRIVLRRQDSPEAVFLLARSYVGAGDLTVAKDTYRRLLDAQPGNTEAAKDLALLYSKEGDAAAVTKILRNVVAIRPDDAEASAGLVQSLLAQRQVNEAETEARRLLKGKAGTAVAEQQLSEVLQAKGSTTEALARYRALLERDPNQVGALKGLVAVLLETGRAPEALDYLEGYPKDNLAASLLLGAVYARQGDVVAARQAYERAIASAPADVSAYLALAALSPTDSPQQLTDLERGWKANPGHEVIGVFLGGILERQGKVEDAIRVYESTHKTNPGNLIVVNNLASLLLENDDKASLVRALQLAKVLDKTSEAVMLDTLGWAYFRTGDLPNAARTLERAVAADSTNPLLQYHLGKAYAAAGNPLNARQHLAKALEQGGGKAAFVADARGTLDQLGK